jgi:hypothetical protein
MYIFKLIENSNMLGCVISYSLKWRRKVRERIEENEQEKSSSSVCKILHFVSLD